MGTLGAPERVDPKPYASEFELPVPGQEVKAHCCAWLPPAELTVLFPSMATVSSTMSLTALEMFTFTASLFPSFAA